MSNMEDFKSAESTRVMSEKTRLALAEIETEKRKAEASGYAVIGGAMAYGEAALSDGIFGKVSSAMKWFVIWSAMVIPVLLFWTVIL